MQTLIDFFGHKHFIPHGFCLSWNPVLLWLHVVSDLLITLSYYSIPLSLAYFIRQRKDLPYAWLVIMGALFIVACGTTHLMSVILIWLPFYWLDGFLKAFTAIISVATALAIWRIIPLLLRLPSIARLQTEINDREQTQATLDAVNIRFRALFDNMRNGVAVYEAIDNGNDFVFQDFNRAGEMLDNISREALLNKPVTQIFPEVERFGLLAVLRRVWETGQPEHLPTTLYQDGRLSVYRDNYVYRLPSGEVVAVFEDVTEQKKAAQAQQETAQRLEKIASRLPGMVYQFRLNPDGSSCFPYASPAIADMYHVSPEEAQTSSAKVFSALHPEDYESVVASITLSAQNLTPWQQEYRVRFEEGTERWLLGNALPQREEDGSILWYGFITDITERKQMEEKLRESEAHLRTIIENEPECIKIVDAQGQLIHMNPAGLAMIEADSLEQVAGRPVLNVIAPKYRMAFAKMHKRVIAGETMQMEFEVQGLKGGRRWLETHAVPMLERNKVVHLAVTRDISQRKQAEQKLRELNRDFVTFLENTSDFIYFKDQDSRIRFCSQTLANITQHESWHDLVGKHDFEIFPAETAQIYYQEELPVFEQGLPLLNKIDPYYNEDGTQGWVSTCKWPVFDFDSQKVIGIFGISRDITQLKQTEQDLLRSNADLEQFAYSVSHDMRQPLRSISGHLQLLARSLKDKLDDDEKENLGFALEGAKRMDAMILSLLEYSRVGRKTQTKAWINSRIVLNEAVEFLTPAIAEAKVELIITGEWGQVFASHDELSRLLMNLISNAVKYREAHQPPCIEIDSVVTANTWKVTVRDYGIGIDPQQISRLFQFFSRLQSRARFEGTGMGLALCRRIVEHHGGQIWVESAGDGQGCCFIFELPLQNEH